MAQEQLTGAKIVLKALADQGVEVIFGYPGGAVLPIYDEIFQQNQIRHILVRHEQAALHAAEGYARSTGRVGVVLVTSGPGATNAVTGLTDALLDSVPLVCITGQVPTHLIGNDAFQEADTTGITRHCTKHNYLVKSPDTLARTIHEAFYVARTGRPGPVVIDLPKDVQMNEGGYVSPDKIRHRSYRPQIKGDVGQIEKAVDLLVTAKKPVIYAGGGVINSGPEACRLLTELTQISGFPITLTLMGLGAYPGSDKQFLGMLGMHGTYEANMAMHACDVLLCVGARFDDRVTGVVSAFSPKSKKIHIDIDPSSINKNVLVDVPVVGDIAHVLEELLCVWKRRGAVPDTRPWWKEIRAWRSVECLKFTQDSELIKPQYAIQRLYELTKDRDTYITTEVGQHQMWAAQQYKFDVPYHWLTSGGLGTMGYGLPSAVGVQLAHPESLVIDISGEASFMMNMQEIGTVAQYRLPVKIFVLNNTYMGMVRQWQELLHGNRYSESSLEVLPDFVKLAEAFGITGLVVDKASDLDAVIMRMIETEGPVIVDVRVDPRENCYPMIPSGKPHNEMLLGPLAEGEEAIDGAGKSLV